MIEELDNEIKRNPLLIPTFHAINYEDSNTDTSEMSALIQLTIFLRIFGSARKFLIFYNHLPK